MNLTRTPSNIIPFPGHASGTFSRPNIHDTIRAVHRLHRLNPKAFAMVSAYVDRHVKGTAAMINGHWKGGDI